MAYSGFICHDDYLAKTASLSDEELGQLFRALMVYHATGLVEEMDGRVSFAFDFIKVDIDRTEKEYQAKCEKNRANRMVAIENARQRSLTVDNERDKEKKRKEKEKTRKEIKRFTPPTVDEVRAYCKERNNSVNPERFVNYYTSKGWKVGKTPMSDWKAAVRTWEEGEKDNAGHTGNSGNAEGKVRSAYSFLDEQSAI